MQKKLTTFCCRIWSVGRRNTPQRRNALLKSTPRRLGYKKRRCNGPPRRKQQSHNPRRKEDLLKMDKKKNNNIRRRLQVKSHQLCYLYVIGNNHRIRLVHARNETACWDMHNKHEFGKKRKEDERKSALCQRHPVQGFVPTVAAKLYEYLNYRLQSEGYTINNKGGCCLPARRRLCFACKTLASCCSLLFFFNTTLEKWYLNAYAHVEGKKRIKRIRRFSLTLLARR